MDDETKAGLDKFNSELEAKGASFVRAGNGDVIFAFKREKLQEFLDQLEKSGQDKILILIQSGGDMSVN